jgi:hypothetical protein
VPALSLIRADFGPPAPAAGPVVPASNPSNDQMLSGLAGYIQDCFYGARDHRQNQGVDDRMLAALRSLRGEYDSATLQDIKVFGGSEIYARIIASKVRGCAALLREIYTASDRPWALSPTPDPALSGASLTEAVQAVLQAEAAEIFAATGQPPAPEMLINRASELRDELLQQRKKVANTALHTREAMIDDVLWEGGFYEALWDFLGDIATFPYAVIKGPVVRFKNQLVWKGNVPGVERKALPKWERCSPFDVYFAPWAQRHQDGYIIHRERVSRAALQSMRGLPNYNTAAIDKVLGDWSPSNCSWYNYNETERADLEQRESEMNPTYNADGNERPMPMLGFYGSISRELAVGWGVPEEQLPKVGADDINVFAYLVGNEVIGVTINPHPAGTLPFYTDSFERVPGSPYGNAIPDLLEDIQGVGNAALRSLVNNLAIASGPMGWMNEDRLAENDPNASKLWPWKIFRFQDPATSGQTEEPMKFFQPDANIHEMFSVYQQMLNMADEISTIPRYMQGSGQGVGGAGRTAAGLSMLMEASNRTIKQTVMSIDTNVIENVVEDLNIFLALTRPDVVMAGDISVIARGAVELMQRETLRMRRLEFLNITNNPLDQQLVGVEGRFHLLKELARDLGMPISDTLPIDEKTVKIINQALLSQSMAALQQPPQQQGTPPAVNGPTGSGGGPNPTEGVARPPDQ